MRKKSKLFESSTSGALIPHINPIFSSKCSGLDRRAVHWCKTCRPLSNSLRGSGSLMNSDPHATPAEGHSYYSHCAGKQGEQRPQTFCVPPLAPKLHNTSLWQSQPREETGSSSLISHNHGRAGWQTGDICTVGQEQARKEKGGDRAREKCPWEAASDPLEEGETEK